MTFKNEDNFVKENHSLSRERVTVFMQVSSTKDKSLRPAFIFKGKGTRTKIDETNLNYQWLPSRSYRLEHMLKTTKNLPNPFNLHNYAVHLMPEIRKALYEGGYILILMGGGITGFIQANDTDLRKRLRYPLRYPLRIGRTCQKVDELMGCYYSRFFASIQKALRN